MNSETPAPFARFQAAELYNWRFPDDCNDSRIFEQSACFSYGHSKYMHDFMPSHVHLKIQCSYSSDVGNSTYLLQKNLKGSRKEIKTPYNPSNVLIVNSFLCMFICIYYKIAFYSLLVVQKYSTVVFIYNQTILNFQTCDKVAL